MFYVNGMHHVDVLIVFNWSRHHADVLIVFNWSRHHADVLIVFNWSRPHVDVLIVFNWSRRSMVMESCHKPQNYIRIKHGPHKPECLLQHRPS